MRGHNDGASNNLTSADYALLAASYITPKLAIQAGLRRVTSIQGAEVLSRDDGGDYSGLVFPYFLPGSKDSHLERVRLDSPAVEYRDGVKRATRRYVAPAQSRNRIYFVPGTNADHLGSTSINIVITEGEKKTLALYRASWEAVGESADAPAFLPLGLAGVYGWRSVIGIEPNARGERKSVKGPISDLDRVVWSGRRVVILFDSNAAINVSVHYAQVILARELQRRGADVHIAELPDEDGVNGVDDYLGKHGLGPTLAVVRAARLFQPSDRLLTIDYTDAGNEEAFELLYGQDFLYDWTTKQWLVWDGTYWTIDVNGKSDRCMLDVAHERLHAISNAAEDPLKYAETGDARHSRKPAFREAFRLRNVRGRQSALLSATTNPEFARTREDFDQKPLLFGCANGVIDLETGRYRSSAREDMMTMRTAVPWVADASYSHWLKFLADIFPDRPDMLTYLRRAVGYCLTGLTREECFWILHGTGRNGKGVFLRVLTAAFGDYASTCEFRALLADSDRNKGPRNDIAAFAGKRFVSAQEPREGCELDEALIKSLTGGDMITARFLHKEFFTFAPTWKIWLAANHRPEIRGSDTGIWSRPRLIPFTVSFEGREDLTLKESCCSRSNCPVCSAGLSKAAANTSSTD